MSQPRTPADSSPLGAFSPATREWFAAAFPAPTAAQLGAWSAASAGRDALVVAPTGSGKTLAAFLWAIDRLASHPAPADKAQRCRVLYISPLKALATDVERNLRAPLVGITEAARRLGAPLPDITVGLRTGDTTPDQRRRLVRTPPDILITTPESLYLMLTSQARESLLGVEHVIVDEIHAVAGTKRGAHLAVSLERLDALLPQPATRIGLSATVRPIEEVARFLAPGRDVAIVQPPIDKRIDLKVVVPVEDLSDIPASSSADPDTGMQGNSVWPHVEERIADLVASHTSTLIFVNSRRLAERLCARLNEIAHQRGTGETLVTPSAPAQAMGGSGSNAGAPAIIARAHHGSVSHDERARIEDDLKSGRLPAVVATSSLELGIDMGAIDLVVQVEAPPSVASGLQRVGRAGHQVGEVSHGVVFPKHTGDLVQTAVVAERMIAGAIETLTVPRNPLDVLAQQVVAAVAVDDWDADELIALMRRSAPFSDLPDSAFEAVLDMLSGKYPSDAFAELRPRLVWDRHNNTLSARPGAQRLAVTSGGTIPDRGLYGVHLVGERSPRVGELDEEMVYESRVGDVFTLGASSWRIEEITHDRVLVSPAPGLGGRLPFWKGDRVGRPVELGAAVGAFVRDMTTDPEPKARKRLKQTGLDPWAIDNLVGYLNEQKAATGYVPDDRTIVVERFRDELGDWRIVVHSPFGAQLHAPWALAINARMYERFGVDVQVVHSDDGIVVRLPDLDVDAISVVDDIVFDADDIERVVTEAVGGSAMFAARFRECAARALLLPRRDPGKRTALWQQRQRSAQLLEIAATHPRFPIVLEAVRECLQDVFDVPALSSLMRDLAQRTVKIVEVETQRPSPFARSLLFDYVASFLYEGDAPLAERRAAALTLDASLLAELLGRAELRELLDADVVETVERELQRLTPDRAVRDDEDLVDALRLLGPLSTDDALARGASASWIEQLSKARRIVEVRIANQARWAVIEDVARLRDGLGTSTPIGLPAALLEPVDDPLTDLVARYARTHGPFAASSCAEHLGLGVAVVNSVLTGLAARGKVIEGEFLPAGSGTEWCDAEVLRRIRRRTLAAMRHEVEPVEQNALARFLPHWQSIPGQLRGPGPDGLLRAIEQLDGVAVPASDLERLILPARVRDYSPALLDAVTTAGEVVWCGRGGLGNDAWISLHLADLAPLTLPPVEPPDSELELHLLQALGTNALFFKDLRPLVPHDDEAALTRTLWDLVASGHLTNDTLAPLRSALLVGKSRRGTIAAGSVQSVRRRSRYPRPGRGDGLGSVLPTTQTSGRWSVLPTRDLDPTRRAHATAEALLDRHGIVTRGAVAAEGHVGGFAATYRVLSAFEEAGRVQRGYVVDGLGGAQFAVHGAIDAVRAQSAQHGPALVLAAADPANPYGAALSWPDLNEQAATGHRPGRKPGAVVVLVDGALTYYVERGGRSLLTWPDDLEALTVGAKALADAVGSGALGRLTVERSDGTSVHSLDTPVTAALSSAGFVSTPRGLRTRR